MKRCWRRHGESPTYDEGAEIALGYELDGWVVYEIEMVKDGKLHVKSDDGAFWFPVGGPDRQTLYLERRKPKCSVSN